MPHAHPPSGTAAPATSPTAPGPPPGPPPPPPPASSTSRARRDDPALSHFVIFNPSLALKQQRGKPPLESTSSSSSGTDPTHDAASPASSSSTPGASSHPTPSDHAPAPPTPTTPSVADSRNPDLEDDLREASQIVFYTSREAGGVSRDRMLRQVGLAKGLMGFADMVVVDEPKSDAHSGTDTPPTYWAIHSQGRRLVVYSPEPDWFIYICISLPRDKHDSKHDPKDKDKDKDKDAGPKPDPPQFTDRMLVDGLQRGYEDFCLLHASLASHLPPTPSLAAELERYWTRFAFAYEAAYISPGPKSPLLTWLGGWPPAGKGKALREVHRGLKRLVDEEDEVSCAGLVAPTGPVAAAGNMPDEDAAGALTRFLMSTLAARMPPPPPPEVPRPEKHLGFGFGKGRRKPAQAAQVTHQTHEARKPSWSLHPLSWMGLGSAPVSRSVTPSPGGRDKDARDVKAEGRGEGLSSLSKEIKEGSIATGESSRAGVGAEEELKRSAAVLDKALEGDTKPPAPVPSKPRWPSLGLGGIGDAMGNMGAALGLSAAPSPKPEAEVEAAGEGVNPVSEQDVKQDEADTKLDSEAAPNNQPESSQNAAGNDPTTDPATTTDDAKDTPDAQDAHDQAPNRQDTRPFDATSKRHDRHPHPSASSSADMTAVPVPKAPSAAPAPAPAPPARDNTQPQPTATDTAAASGQPTVLTEVAGGAHASSASSTGMGMGTGIGTGTDAGSESTRGSVVSLSLVSQTSSLSVDEDPTEPDKPTAVTAQEMALPELPASGAGEGELEPRAEVEADAISLAPSLAPSTSGVSQSDVVLPDLAAAVESDVSMPWRSRLVWLGGEQQRLHWVTRDASLLFTLGPAEAQPPTTGSAILTAYAAHSAKPPKPHPDTVITHTGSVTALTGTLDPRESALLSAMRRAALDLGVNSIFAQGARMTAAKWEDDGEETYVVAGRRDASLTDAERVLRAGSASGSGSGLEAVSGSVSVPGAVAGVTS